MHRNLLPAWQPRTASDVVVNPHVADVPCLLPSQPLVDNVWTAKRRLKLGHASPIGASWAEALVVPELQFHEAASWGRDKIETPERRESEEREAKHGPATALRDRELRCGNEL